MNRFVRTRLAWMLAWLLAVAARDVRGQEQSFSEGNCALTPPPGWRRLKLETRPNFVVAYGDPAGTRTLLVLALERGKVHETLDDHSIAEFDKGIEDSGGGPKTSGRSIRFVGFEAYERHGTAVAKGKNLTTFIVAIPTGNGDYVLEALGSNGEVSNDEEIRQAFNSFHFLRPPGLPREPRNASYKLGYLIGQLLMGGTILGVVVWVVIKLVPRRHPPLPTGPSGPYPYPQVGLPPPPVVPPPLPPTGPTHPPTLPPATG